MLAICYYYPFAINHNGKESRMEGIPPSPSQADRGRLPQFIVRMPEELHTHLKSRAAENRRSMNAEIVSRLDRSVKQDKGGAA